MTLRCSVVVVSRGRPDALMRCLDGVAQLDHPDFEVIVVACPAGQAAVLDRSDAGTIKLVGFDEANISKARNLGVNEAAGEVVAFIDDDAVPEPLWLQLLTEPLTDGADAAGGFVLGRNGISLQWGARQVNADGSAKPLALKGDSAQTPKPARRHAVKTEGTNMAFRRDALVAMGGFDPAYIYYLDETDLNWRMAQAGMITALVPQARVHHGFAENSLRRADRIPLDLTPIAASQMVFLRKHCRRSLRKEALRAFREEQRRRVLRLMQRGPFGAGDVRRLMRSFETGIRLGKRQDLAPHTVSDVPMTEFLPYPGRPGAERQVFAGRPREARELRRLAAQAISDGAIATLFVFSPTARYHRVRFTEQGIWEQTGGRFGRSDRTMPLVRYWRFKRRVAAELRRLGRSFGN